jgi:hypothetical protein
LTVPAAAYYLRGDECPRCLTAMEPAERFRRVPVAPPVPPEPVAAERAVTAAD